MANKAVVTSSSNNGNRKNGVSKGNEKMEKKKSKPSSSPSTNIKHNQKNKTNGRNNTPLKNQQPQQQQQRPKKYRFFATTNIIGLLRTLLIDFPLLILLILSSTSLILVRVHNQYVLPQLEAMEWTEERMAEENTYYARYCNESDITTTSIDDLIIPSIKKDTADDSTTAFTARDAMDHMNRHGVSVYPDILSPSTMKELRNYILERNQNLAKSKDAIFVLENENRYSFGIGVNDHPSIPKALHEIATHPTFRPAIQEIAGRNPAVIENTAITACYGARDQAWHADVTSKTSALRFSRSFIPSYSLFIPLQDTTADMGATHICPGTHMCTNDQSADFDFCDENDMRVSGNASSSYIGKGGGGGVWKKGYGALVNQQTYHRGPGHYDPDAECRVLFILTFAPRPKQRMESRQLGHGGSFSTRWDMWGHTLNDLVRAEQSMSQPWATLRSLGLYKRRSSSSDTDSTGRTDWGWIFPDIVLQRISNFDTGFGTEDLFRFVEKGGFARFLPSFLHNMLGFESGIIVNEDAKWPYQEYLFADVLSNVVIAILKLNAVVIVAYLSVLVCIGIVKLARKKQHPMQLLRRALVRLWITCAAVFFGALMVNRSIDSSGRAIDLNLGNAFTSAFVQSTMTTTTSLSSPARSVENDPTTFPLATDVLVPARYGSKYLASYNHFVDGHPGNILWNSLIRNKARVYNAYSGLPPTFKCEIVKSIVKAVQGQPGRFLVQNAGGSWTLPSSSYYHPAALTRRELEKWIKRETVTQRIKEEIEFALSECKYEFKRHTAMMRIHAPNALENLQKRIVFHLFDKDESDQDSSSSRMIVGATVSSSSTIGAMNLFARKQRLLNIVRTVPSFPFTRRLLPMEQNEAVPTEPRPGAWFKSGDTVTTRNVDWAVIIEARPDGSYWIEDANEIGTSKYWKHIHRFIPFEQDEIVEARGLTDDTFDTLYPSQVDRVHGDGTYDLFMNTFGFQERVPEHFIRRILSDAKSFEEEDVDAMSPRVLARFQLGEMVEGKYKGKHNEWYKGVITKENFGGTYSVKYVDGDRDKLAPQHLRKWVPFQLDELVEARNLANDGDKFFHLSRVTRVHNDGTYDLMTEDFIGAQLRVPEKHIRRFQQQHQPQKSFGEKLDMDGPTTFDEPDGSQYEEDATEFEGAELDATAPSSKELNVGDIVEGRYQGAYNEWYKGVIKKIDVDGVYQIEYMDGEQDYLPNEHIRPFVPFAVGEVVEARKYQFDEDDGGIGHAPIFYRSRIIEDHYDGTFDVLMNIFGLQKGVPSKDLRRVEHVLGVGDRVESKFMGSGEEWFSGSIVALNKDGTYNIQYDDGDKDYSVMKKHIRLALEQAEGFEPRPEGWP